MAGRNVRSKDAPLAKKKSVPLKFKPFESVLKNFQLQPPTTLEEKNDQDSNRPDRRTEGSG